ncbi:Rieske 2Fe-2S domain-containing protein [Chitinophaga sp. sic0106]|uniref:Rieske (2Fe-2S) protein n=1 Tax=Chitinophaga sp. sic0106 TaxID=2854785 RepID=UPI001C462213|nr:Rieske 2Fe-2S domain-containing protein [Chitinophaga sp. sic0106]MBV7528523.1 Rieske 2Fe-2S domain-containing protein [Chitinophaga sp. sic0106]
MSKEYTWHRLDDASLPTVASDLKILEVNGKKLCCTLYGGQLFAFAYKCPHASGIMADGFIDGAGNVVCPLHRYKFDLRNGRNVSGEGYFLKTYPVEQRPEGTFLGMEKSSGWLW